MDLTDEDRFGRVLRYMCVSYNMEPTTTGTVYEIETNDHIGAWYFDHDGKFIATEIKHPEEV